MKKFAALLLSVILVAGVFTGVTLVVSRKPPAKRVVPERLLPLNKKSPYVRM